MKEFLAKAWAALKQTSLMLLAVIRRVVALLQSVTIDQSRGVLLCIAFQLLVVLAVLVTFRSGLATADSQDSRSAGAGIGSLPAPPAAAARAPR